MLQPLKHDRTHIQRHLAFELKIFWTEKKTTTTKLKILDL